GEVGDIRVQASGRDAAGERDGVVALARIHEEEGALRIGRIVGARGTQVQRVEHVDVNRVVARSGVYLGTLGADDVDDGLRGRRRVDDRVDEIRRRDLAKRRVTHMYRNVPVDAPFRRVLDGEGTAIRQQRRFVAVFRKCSVRISIELREYLVCAGFQ